MLKGVGMRNKAYLSYAIIIGSILCSTLAIAQSKNIICKRELTEAFLIKHTKSREEAVDKYGSQFGDQKELERERAEVETCRKSGLTYSHMKSFTFDKKALTNTTSTNAEGFTVPCWSKGTNVVKFRIETTPSIISFIDNQGDAFNIDRETLKAGYGTNRDFSCIIKEKQLKNKI